MSMEIYIYLRISKIGRIRGTFLDYQSLLRKVPNCWKRLFNENKPFSILNRFNVTCNIYIQETLKDKKGCRRFYDTMRHACKIQTEYKWIQELGMIGNQEYRKYNQAIQTVKEVKLNDFQYKTTNKILVTQHAVRENHVVFLYIKRLSDR